MSTLLGLPTELILRVLAEVEPLDLIRMSQVCKRTSHILGDRAVWEDAVGRVCQKSYLFKPSLQPLDSLELDGLRKAALRPRLFHTKLSKASGQVYPSLERSLEYSVGETGRSDFIQANIIPGGRYLIGLAERNVCLWDLGPPGTAPSPALIDIGHSDSLHFELYAMSTPSQSSHESYKFAVHGHTLGVGDSQVYMK
ncbi:hypothetical protein FA13DRAFT_1268429 [Coprinellus micaceus]|uniref:F-box domain-containing protein n=1 Tax=Coprinellus micaceus TaxID=71717 RepID=A0A4Y7SSW6_COPMI|nr:hypothetical protein FA13DRAFT_1268429 [Coprinellus micaceus]